MRAPDGSSASASLAMLEDDIAETFIRASGPGGQNVNKVATAVQLRFDVRNARGLAPEVRLRLERLAGRRLTRDGVLVITAQEHRSQERNRQAARHMLADLVQQASVVPKHRRPTRVPQSTRLRRMDEKLIRGQRKRERQRPTES